jgi:hypothetical protein
MEIFHPLKKGGIFLFAFITDNTFSHTVKHKKMKWQNGIPVQSASQSFWPEGGCLL